jgi:hypothetical protein
MLSDLQGKPTRFGPPRAPDEPIDFEFLSAEWKKTFDKAQNAIARSQDSGLQQELDSVVVEWNALVEQKALTVAAPGNVGHSQENSILPAVKIAERSKRRGRPSGSGSYEALDAQIVEQMREVLIKEKNLSPTAAAMRFADGAIGGGTVESKAKRLAERYSAKYGDQPR